MTDSELVERESTLPIIGAGTFTPLGWVPPDQKLTPEAWGELFQGIVLVGKAYKFCLGDLIEYGESRYGEKYAHWIEATDFEGSSLQNIAWVCRHVSIDRRRENLSWTHHYNVAALDPQEQIDFLFMAEDEGWDCHKLAREVKMYQRIKRSKEDARYLEYERELREAQEHVIEPAAQDPEPLDVPYPTGDVGIRDLFAGRKEGFDESLFCDQCVNHARDIYAQLEKMKRLVFQLSKGEVVER